MGSKYNFEPFDKWCIENIDENFLEKYWDYERNIYDPSKIGKGSRKETWIKCQDNPLHGSYKTLAYTFTGMGQRCPYCSGKKVHITDSLGYKFPEVIDLWSDKNELSPYDYTYGSGKDVWLKCNNGNHDDYLTKPYRAKEHLFKCPKCVDESNKSSLQKKVEELIRTEFGYKMLFEDNCSIRPVSPKGHKNSTMPYDIEIPELKLIIEVQGQQHYEITGWVKNHAERNGTTPEQELQEQQKRDELKKLYAIDKGYNYLQIPYWFEKFDAYKDLLRNTIYHLISNTEI